ncbi:MAG: hypothetical protein ACYC7F_04300, partial [Gemmatimonadaceae bacterium]
ADRRLATLGAAAWTCGLLALLVVISRDVPLIDGLLVLTTPVLWAIFAVGVSATGLLLAAPTVAEGTPRESGRWDALPLALGLPLLTVVLAKPFGRGWLPESPTAISRRLHLSRPLPKEAGAMRWALNDSPPGSLFAVPPVDQNWVRFRLAAQRGVYASVHDVNQLWYVRHDVVPAVRRLETLGVITKGPHNFDARPYLQPPCARLRQLSRDGVGFYVLPAESVAPAGSVFSYRDSNYGILDVQRTASGCSE